MGRPASIERANHALQAGQRARIVQHASLRPAREDDAAQMRFAVEDALNTADFADCGRLIVVRQLRLANVPPRASAAWMARAMESAWRALSMQAVPASHPSAMSAPAVYFASRVEARIAWLERVARGQEVHACFWAAAVPESKADAAHRDDRLSRVASVLLRESAPSLVAALHTWPDEVVVRLARAMPRAMHARLLAALTAEPPLEGAQASSPARVSAAKALPPSLAPAAARLARDAPLPEDAAPWIAALWTTPVLGRAPVPSEVEAVVTRAVWMAAGVSPLVAVDGTEASPAAPSAVSARSDARSHAESFSTPPSSRLAADALRSPNVADDAAMPASPAAWRVESGLQPTPRHRARRTDARPQRSRGLPWLADAAFSSNGGLMLVLNVLRAMRFDAPSPALVDALLLHLLDAVGASQDEPQRAWFAVDALLPVAGGGDFDRLSPNGIGLPQPGASNPQPERPPAHRRLRLWRLRIRRTLRRHVGLDLTDLICRPAWVSATPTHIDVVYPMSQTDLRLRRRGLDADPGWVPWFGRIVTFHFIDDDLLPSKEDDHG